MHIWTDGYVSDITYTSGFYRELAPSYLNRALLMAGHHPLGTDGGPLRYLELACGQGFGTALLAACLPAAEVWGCDFNPGQIAHARGLAAAADLSNLRLEEMSFQEFAANPPADCPMFDVITLHGIYSWISAENRAAIVRILADRLAPGGVVYVSYNSMPGWAAMAPVQRLLREHANRHPGRSDRQVREALQFVSGLQAAGAQFFSAHPSLAARLDALPRMHPHYLAHEYLNGHWHPLYHADVVAELAVAKLSYVTSAHGVDTLDGGVLPPALVEAIRQAPDPVMAQTIRDFAINQAFRRDVFVRGPVPMTPLDRRRALADSVIALCVPRQAVVRKLMVATGELDLRAEVYDPLLDALAAGPLSLAEVSQLPVFAQQPDPLATAAEAATMLIAAAQVHPAAAAWSSDQGAAARAFNRVVADRVSRGADLAYLAAPRLGTGLPAGSLDMLVYKAISNGHTPTVEAVADPVWRDLQALGARMRREGVILDSEADNRAELHAQLHPLITTKVPLWQQLGVL